MGQHPLFWFVWLNIKKNKLHQILHILTQAHWQTRGEMQFLEKKTLKFLDRITETDSNFPSVV